MEKLYTSPFCVPEIGACGSRITSGADQSNAEMENERFAFEQIRIQERLHLQYCSLLRGYF